ncbi:methyltransferase family protein [Aquimarina intermedia]|uniref:Methyltransferase family protein n=2 Tax=Aquimarina intermedia TaxID=350814 RepID=A0A5S5C2Q6_9FLAO|nr:methyltransferase family protein [Aquimarina intermedia]
MHYQAKEINAHFVSDNDISFQLYDGKHIPFSDHSFETIMTVNTIYFWQNPKTYLSELCRVLRPNGNFILTFATKKFMKGLSFAKHGFTLYELEDVKKLIKTTGFTISETKELEEVVQSKDGSMVHREFVVVKLLK